MRRVLLSALCLVALAPAVSAQDNELLEISRLASRTPSPLKQAEVLRALEAVRGDCGYRNDETVIRAAADAIAALPQLQDATAVIARYDVPAFRAYYDEVIASHGDRVTETEIARAAIEAMVLSVDPRNQLVDNRYALGRGPGYLDIVLLGRRNGITVVSTAPNRGAARAGLLPGDIIEQVDGTPTAGLGTNSVFAMARGPRDGVARLTIRRGAEVMTIDVPRDVGACGEACEVSGRAEGDIGIITVPYRINPDVEERVGAALAEILLEAPSPRGYILDLRGNRGGPTVPTINALADLFLTRGAIIRSDSCSTGRVARSPARRGDILDGAPLIVLIDGSTNSGAEGVAAALVEHGRAIAVGQRTIGDGAARQRTHLTDSVYIRLNRSLFVTPSGAPIDGVGVVPTHETPPPSDGRDPAMERALELLRR